MSLRARFGLYLVLVHLAFAGLALFLLVEHRLWLVAAEAFLALSVAVGFGFLQRFRIPPDLARTGADLIAEQDFTCKFLPTGHAEMDQLVQVYNRMIDRLRDERSRLQEQHYFLDKILAASPSGVLTFDFDGRIAQANPRAEQLLQVSAGEMRGKKLTELGSGLAQDLHGLEAGRPQVFTLPDQRRVRCHRGWFVDQGFQRCFVLLEELTEELRQSEKAAYERTIRLLSHEVNNSAAAVGSLLQSCLNYQDQLREEDRQDFATALQVAISRTDNLNAFMKGYADVVRLPQPRPAPVDVADLLRGIGSLLQAECRQRRIAWAWDLEEALGPIPMDRGQMEQVFVNILRNAVEAIREDGRITIRLGRKAGRPQAVVEDTGEGIAPQVRASLFTPFFSTKENGQGIGLTLVQEVLTRHGFGYSLESEPGQPTRFSVLF